MSPVPSNSPLLIILDTGVVFQAFKFKVWEGLVAKYRVILLEDVLREVKRYEDAEGNHHAIDLTLWIKNKSIKIVTVTLDETREFLKRFDQTYSQRMDAGELASLVYLMKLKGDEVISSGDGIVYKTLGKLNQSQRGLSLEELLNKVGLTKHLDYQFTKSFRDRYTQMGETDFVTGF